MTTSYEFNKEIDIVFGLLTNPQFLVDRCLQLGELEAECEVYEEDNATKINLARTVQRNIPAFLARLFNGPQNGYTMYLEMTTTWQADGKAGWQGSTDTRFEQLPVNVSQQLKLYPTDTGCCFTIAHRAKVNIPLIGRKVERYIDSQSQAGLEQEIAYLRQQLG